MSVLPDRLVLRTGRSNWRLFIPSITADVTTNYQPWSPDGQFNNVNLAVQNEIAMQFSYFAAYWLNRNKAAVNVVYQVPVYGSGGTFSFRATTANPITSYQGLYPPVNGSYLDLTVQQDGIDAGIIVTSGSSFLVNSGIYTHASSKVDVPGFPLGYMRPNLPWFITTYFFVNDLTQTYWKPIIGSAYTTVSQTGFWGIWLSNNGYYVHWRNDGTSQFNGNTTLKVTSSEWHVIIVKYDPSNKKELKFSLRKVYDTTTQKDETITQSGDFLLQGVLGNVTSGGWENLSTEKFPGKIERVSIGTIPTTIYLSDLIISSYPSSEVPQTFTLNTSSIGSDVMINVDKTSATLTSNGGSNVSITKNSTDNWNISISTIGTYTLTYTFTDPLGFYPKIVTSGSIIMKLIAATLSASQTIFYQKFVSGASISFNVISSNAGAVSRTHESNNTAVVTIPTASTPSATIVGPGKTTIKVTQPQTGSYAQVVNNDLVTIVVVGQGKTYTSEIFPASFDLSGTNLSNSTFTDCTFTSTNLFGITVDASTNFSTCTFTGVGSGRITGVTSRLPVGFVMI